MISEFQRPEEKFPHGSMGSDWWDGTLPEGWEFASSTRPHDFVDHTKYTSASPSKGDPMEDALDRMFRSGFPGDTRESKDPLDRMYRFGELS